MNQETKTCQNCKKAFIVEPEDFLFYQKIKVPPPTWCPECRRQRRLLFRNERSLYKRKCDLCEKEIISMYSKDSSFPVYCSDDWWGDKWDSFSYGKDYDLGKTFFEQFNDLKSRVPQVGLIIVNVINSQYCNYVADTKNSYLCFGSIHIEDCGYGSPYESKDSYDSFLARECELCYECVDCEKLYHSSYCQDCSGSSHLFLCYDCQGCNDCIGCAGLRQKQYHIFNQAYSKDEYRNLVSNPQLLNEIKENFIELKNKCPHKYSRILYSKDATGNYIVNSKNSKFVFGTKKIEESKYLTQVIDAKDTYDVNYCEHLELGYEHIGYFGNNRVIFSNTCGESFNVIYSYFCANSNNLFGCVGLRKKQYCILNKQYTKEEYEQLVPKIIAHMNTIPYVDKKGRIYKYGEFFPPELSPFSYNETIAQEYFPLTKEQALEQGYSWKDPEPRNYQIDIKNEDLPDHIKDVDDSIINKVIECSHRNTNCNEMCTEAFRIIEPELQFYKKMNLPLPRLCPNCRHYQRLKQRNPLKLWYRKCMCQGGDKFQYENTIKHFHGDTPCPNEFETSYSPERQEIVYCEACYNAEVV